MAVYTNTITGYAPNGIIINNRDNVIIMREFHGIQTRRYKTYTRLILLKIVVVYIYTDFNIAKFATHAPEYLFKGSHIGNFNDTNVNR